MNQQTLNGKVAIVTGAGLGVGRAIAIRLAALGARVIVNDIDEKAANQISRAIRAEGGESVVVVGSVSTTETAEALVKTAADRWNHLDILVNSAAVTRDAEIHLMPDEWFELVMDVSVKGTFQCIRAATPLMRFAAQADLDEGKRVYRKIVNVISTAGIYGAAGRVAHVAAMAAVVGITKTVAREWAPFLVNCNAVARGSVAPDEDAARSTRTVFVPDGPSNRGTPPFESWKPGFNQDEDRRHSVPLGRIGTPEDVAGAVAFLSGPDSDFITGMVLEVSGGMM